MPATDGHPWRLRMDLEGNPLRCGGDICWIKEAVTDGWLSSRHGYHCFLGDDDDGDGDDDDEEEEILVEDMDGC